MKHNPLVNYKAGFYLNKKKVVHYISADKICISLKTICPQDQSAFFKNLAYQSDPDYLEKNYKTIKVQNPYWVLTSEAEYLVKQLKVDQAAKLLSTAIKIVNHWNYRDKKSFLKYVISFFKVNQRNIPVLQKDILVEQLGLKSTLPLSAVNDISPHSYKKNIPLTRGR